MTATSKRAAPRRCAALGPTGAGSSLIALQRAGAKPPLIAQLLNHLKQDPRQNRPGDPQGQIGGKDLRFHQ